MFLRPSQISRNFGSFFPTWILCPFPGVASPAASLLLLPCYSLLVLLLWATSAQPLLSLLILFLLSFLRGNSSALALPLSVIFAIDEKSPFPL